MSLQKQNILFSLEINFLIFLVSNIAPDNFLKCLVDQPLLAKSFISKDVEKLIINRCIIAFFIKISCSTKYNIFVFF